MPALTLRLITAMDAAAYKVFQVNVCRETDFLAWTGNEVASKDIDYFTQVILMEDRTPWVFWLIAEEGGHIVGEVKLNSSDLARCAHNAHMAIGLCKSHWGTGLAKRLFIEAAKWAKHNSITQITLGVMAHNARAIAFYKAQGCVEEGRRLGRFKVNGTSVDEIMMRKEI